MCVRALVLYRFFVVAFRSDASSAALLDRFVPKHDRCVVKVVNLSPNLVRDVCLNLWDVDLVVTRLVIQQCGLAWLGFLMIAAAMAGSSVFVWP